VSDEQHQQPESSTTRIQYDPGMSPEEQAKHRTRDSETLTILGAFVTVLAIAVIIGTFFAERPHAMVVNAIAGVVLLIAGGVLVWRGRVLAKPKDSNH